MLQVLKKIIDQGTAAGLQVSLCGELAGDPMGALLLVGMGYRNLSMNGRSVARIKYLLRNIELSDAEGLAQRVLSAQMTTEVRHQVAAFMERRGMGGLIRGGR
jgi:phosphotransferase system enzyme I (PtsP)